MLKRIESIRAIGLLNDTNGSRYEMRKAALLYADNGRGKSTLAAILRSCAQNLPALVTNRKTLDSTLSQSVLLQFDNGHQVRFDAGTWTEARPEILIFDADFVEQNVYSGSQVTPGQRQNLLHFALGVTAVNAQKEYDIATTVAAQAATTIREQENRISGFHLGKTLQQFQAIQPVDDADNKITALRLRITTTENIAVIQNKPIPRKIEEPAFDIATLFSILNKTLDNIDLEAEGKVREHFKNHGSGNIESWVDQGQQFETHDNCPYCEQSLSGLELIKAYRTYFNKEYKELTRQIASLPRGIELRCGDQIIERILTQAATAREVAAGWLQHLQIVDFPFDEVAARNAVGQLRVVLNDLTVKKAANPVSAVGSEADMRQAELLWNILIQNIKALNGLIDSTINQINSFKSALTMENIPALQEEIAHIELAKRRYDPVVVGLIAELATARANDQAAKQAKQQKKDALSQIMDATLARYQTEINNLLQDFGAAFKIQSMGANFRGDGSPRSDYGISMRGQQIPLTGDNQSFKTTMSEGDKRSLAFAFFIALLKADQQLSTKVIVIDDPMCSLDLNRKQKTADVLKQIYLTANQLIIFAHDPYFLKKLRDSFSGNSGVTSISICGLRHGQNDYSQFTDVNIDEICESTYFKHHRILNEYLDGVTHNISEISKTIRPVLEGYIHRRFPGRVPSGRLFGEVIGMIQTATLPNPLAHAHPIVGELNSINTYAGQFHHDTNPSADNVQIVESELRTYVRRALAVIHKGIP